ncbi:MAG: serine hydrolase domain-containing protein [Chloroflexota bacterium]
MSLSVRGPVTASPSNLERDLHLAPDLEAARIVASRFVRDGQLPCVLFGVVDAEGHVVTRSVNAAGQSFDENTIFFLASVTKAVVATAVMQYADEGRLDLHEPLTHYLPEFEGGSREKVSAAHVLTHTSGLPDMEIETLRNERPSYQRSLDFALASTPASEPGSRYEYCSSAWLLLSETMARLSEMSFEETLGTRLTGPLGMADTNFDPRRARARLAPVHGFRIQNRLVQEILLRFLVRARLPGGGMFGTIADLLRLGRSLLPASGTRPGLRILSQAAIAEMSRNQTDGMTHELDDGSTHEVRQALGWRKPRAGWPGSEAAFTHAGISGGRLWVDPQAGLAFAFLTNLWQAPEEPALAVLEEVYRAWA